MLDIQAEDQKFRQKLGNRQEPTYKPEARAAQTSPHTDIDHPGKHAFF